MKRSRFVCLNWDNFIFVYMLTTAMIHFVLCLVYNIHNHSTTGTVHACDGFSVLIYLRPKLNTEQHTQGSPTIYFSPFIFVRKTRPTFEETRDAYNNEMSSSSSSFAFTVMKSVFVCLFVYTSTFYVFSSG
jgi:hypothetical protein